MAVVAMAGRRLATRGCDGTDPRERWRVKLPASFRIRLDGRRSNGGRASRWLDGLVAATGAWSVGKEGAEAAKLMGRSLCAYGLR